jgi:hypothetical protein
VVKVLLWDNQEDPVAVVGVLHIPPVQLLSLDRHKPLLVTIPIVDILEDRGQVKVLGAVVAAELAVWAVILESDQVMMVDQDILGVIPD